MYYDHTYDSAAMIIAWETLNADGGAAVLPFAVEHWLPYVCAQKKKILFPTSRNICIMERGVQHQVELSVFTSVSWQCPPPTRAYARATPSVFASKCFPAGITPPLTSSQASPAANFSSFAPPPVSPSSSLEPVSVASPIVSVVPTHSYLSFQQQM